MAKMDKIKFLSEIDVPAISISGESVDLNNLGSGETPTEGLEYVLSDDGTYYICAGIGSATSKKIVIASTYNNLPVTEIGARAFFACEDIVSIEIPSSIASISAAVCLRCTGLTHIVIPEGVTSIGGTAFAGCTNLKSIQMPRSLKTVSTQAFGSCVLESVYYTGTKEEWDSIDISLGARLTLEEATMYYSYAPDFATVNQQIGDVGALTTTNKTLVGAINELADGSGSGNANIDVTAEVGQSIVVKQVDQNGKPTEWEAATLEDKTYTEYELVIYSAQAEIQNHNGAAFVPIPTSVLFKAGVKYKITVDNYSYVGTAIKLDQYAIDTYVGNILKFDASTAPAVPNELFAASLYEDVNTTLHNVGLAILPDSFQSQASCKITISKLVYVPITEDAGQYLSHNITLPFEFDEDYGAYIAGGPLLPTMLADINPEEVFDVCLDGTHYLCEIKQGEFEDTSFLYLGNAGALGMPATEEPFAVIFDKTNLQMVGIVYTPGDYHTVSMLHATISPNADNLHTDIIVQSSTSASTIKPGAVHFERTLPGGNTNTFDIDTTGFIHTYKYPLSITGKEFSSKVYSKTDKEVSWEEPYSHAIGIESEFKTIDDQTGKAYIHMATYPDPEPPTYGNGVLHWLPGAEVEVQYKNEAVSYRHNCIVKHSGNAAWSGALTYAFPERSGTLALLEDLEELIEQKVQEALQKQMASQQE